MDKTFRISLTTKFWLRLACASDFIVRIDVQDDTLKKTDRVL